MTAKRPTVWVLKEQVTRGVTGPTPMDYTPAYRFGDVRFITDFDLPLTHRSSLAVGWMKAVFEFLKKIDCAEDYIILTGAPLAIFMLGVLVASQKAPPKILVWRREQNAYMIFDPVDVIDVNAIA